MRKELNVEIDKKLLKLLDKHRGDLSRSEYIKKVLSGSLDKDRRMNFSNTDASKGGSVENIPASDLASFLENFQVFANDIHNRLDNLEKQIVGYTEEFQEIEDVEFNDPEYENRQSSSTSVSKSVSAPRSASGSTSTSTESDGFEYGCPFCSATIPKDASRCPNCGNKFDEFVVTDNDQIVEDVDDIYDQDESNEIAIVEPLSEAYNDSGEYDPRPNSVRVKNNGRGSGRYNASQNDHISKRMPSKYSNNSVEQHVCSICGDGLVFIKDFQRWYCYGCKKYSSGAGEMSAKLDRPQPINVQAQAREVAPGESEMPEKKPKKNWKPLKGYHKYKE